MKYLIVAADDFGITESVNVGIAKAYKEGIVNYINMLPAGDAFQDAVNKAGELGLKEIGAHLTLSEVKPLSDAKDIKSILSKSGAFNKDCSSFFASLYLGNINPEHIYIELKNQLEAVRRTDLAITNISGHQHIQMAPKIFKIFQRLAKEYNIPSIRYPYEDRIGNLLNLKKLYKYATFSILRKRIKKELDASNLVYADYFRGFLDSGGITENILTGIIKDLKDGVTELVTHPGFLSPDVVDKYTFHMNCEEELFALTSPRVKKLISELNIKLIGYRELIGLRSR